MIDLNFWETIGLWFVLSILVYGANVVLTELREIRKSLQQIRHELANRPPR